MNKTKLIHISTRVEVVFEVWLEIVLKINFHRWVGGWVAGSIETKAISASDLKLKLTEAELGNKASISELFCVYEIKMTCDSAANS